MRPVRAAALGLLLGLLACAAQPSPPAGALPLTVYLVSSQCRYQGAEPLAARVAAPEAYRRSAVGARQTPIKESPDLPETMHILLSMGTQPSTGFELENAAPSAILADGVLTIRVRWITPAVGRIQAQVITHPCMLLQLPAAPVREIVVIDQTGRERIRQLL